MPNVVAASPSAEQILALGGALISEFKMGAFAASQNFPIRNRILSGMSRGVLMVEAAEYVGGRITAGCALEQNRDVFAVKGNVTNKNSWGPNTLIKRGAKLVATLEDVWKDLPPEVKLALAPRSSPESGSTSSASLIPDEGLPPHEKRILSLLKADEAVHIDEIVELGDRVIFVRDFCGAIRTRARRQDPAHAGEEFCEEFLAGQTSAYCR